LQGDGGDEGKAKKAKKKFWFGRDKKGKAHGASGTEQGDSQGQDGQQKKKNGIKGRVAAIGSKVKGWFRRPQQQDGMMGDGGGLMVNGNMMGGMTGGMGFQQGMPNQHVIGYGGSGGMIIDAGGQGHMNMGAGGQMATTNMQMQHQHQQMHQQMQQQMQQQIQEQLVDVEDGDPDDEGEEEEQVEDGEDDEDDDDEEEDRAR
jgi:hypothetical protein